MRELGIDIETYSGVDLVSCGVYRYAEADDFAVLLFGYSVDGGAAECVDVASGEEVPADIIAALTDPSVLKTAFNAAFERVCLARWLGRTLPPEQWDCTQAAAARLGFPQHLGQCAEALRLSERKMDEGRSLIRLFSIPRGGKRTYPNDDKENWELFKEYNRRDVEVEQAIRKRVCRLATTATERAVWALDQHINDRGVMIDDTLAERALGLDDKNRAELLAEAKRLTGLDNPCSPAGLKEYLHGCGVDADSVSKENIASLRARLKDKTDALRLLDIRIDLARTSTRKLDAMLGAVCGDYRLRGMLKYYGARTGRWAGKLVQVQNLPRITMPRDELERARQLARSGDYMRFKESFPDTAGTLAQLVRAAFMAAPGNKLIVCDYSQIEARVLAWLADEQWALSAFTAGRDIYTETACRMFGEAGKEQRAKGKVATLALGYGGGSAALAAMDGGQLDDTERAGIVRLWRAANANTVKYWRTVEDAAGVAIAGGGIADDGVVRLPHGMKLYRKWGMLLIQLPSGRHICYPRARADSDGITYESGTATTAWTRVRTYGGKLVENITQAVARDILAEAMLSVERAGLRVVLHVHDEVIIECPCDRDAEQVSMLFNIPPDWAPSLPLASEAFECDYYNK